MIRAAVVVVLVALLAPGSADLTAPTSVCRDYGAPTLACVPAVSPDGARVLAPGAEEDGSARYADGWVFDAEDGWRG